MQDRLSANHIVQTNKNRSPLNLHSSVPQEQDFTTIKVLAQDSMAGNVIYLFDVLLMVSFKPFFAVAPHFAWLIAGVMVIATIIRLAFAYHMKNSRIVSARATLLFSGICSIISMAVCLRAIKVIELFGIGNTISIFGIFGVTFYACGMVTSFRSVSWVLYSQISLILCPFILYLFSSNIDRANSLGLVVTAYWLFLLFQGRSGHALWKNLRATTDLVANQKRQLQTFVDEIPGAIAWLNDAKDIVGANHSFNDLIENSGGVLSPEIAHITGSFRDSLANTLSQRIVIKAADEEKTYHITLKKYLYYHEQCVFLILVDVESQVRLEKELEQRQISAAREKSALQNQLFHTEKLATIGTLAAGIAHEINNPLAIVKGYTMILAKRPKTPAILENEVKIFEAVDKAINRIATITDGLRTYARADTDHMEALDINHIIEATLPLVYEISKKSGVEIRQHLDPIVPHVRGNIGKIQQVLINLLNNACDALQARPAERRITIETIAGEEIVTLLLADNGPGIPADILDKIFDPFFTTKEVGKGTGLGLSISRAIIQSFGGALEILANNVEGVTFSITLQRMKPEVMATCDLETTQPSIPQLKGKIIVIDDEPDVCALLKNQLEEAGLTVVVKNDPIAALQIMKQTRFDLVITDMQMPELTGIGLIKKVQKIECQAGTKFLVLTGGITTSYSKEDRDFLREAVQGYIMKPWEPGILLELIGSLLIS